MRILEIGVFAVLSLSQQNATKDIPVLKLFDPEGPARASDFPIEARDALNKYPTSIGYRFNPKALEQLAKELPGKKLGDEYELKLPNEKGEMMEARMRMVRSKPDGKYPSFGFHTSIKRPDQDYGFGTVTIHAAGGKVTGVNLSALNDGTYDFSAVNYRCYRPTPPSTHFYLVAVADLDPVYLKESYRPLSVPTGPN